MNLISNYDIQTFLGKKLGGWDVTSFADPMQDGVRIQLSKCFHYSDLISGPRFCSQVAKDISMLVDVAKHAVRSPRRVHKQPIWRKQTRYVRRVK